MEHWVPLFDIFLNSPAPETEAAFWLQQSFCSSSSSSSSSMTPPITGGSFISLLMKPCDVLLVSGKSPPTISPLSPSTKTVMFIETLPSVVQSRILSFLTSDYSRFCSRDLSKLASEILNRNEEIDFWVERAAHNLLGRLSDTNCEWISSLSLASKDERVCEEFVSVPRWLDDASISNNLPFPCLPLSMEELDSAFSLDAREKDDGLMSQVGENIEENTNEAGDEIKLGHPENVDLEPEVQQRATELRAIVMSCDSTSKAMDLATEIQKLCMVSGANTFTILGLIEPWKADDEIVSVLISNLSDGTEEELSWPSQVLSSVALPKLLSLERPVSRVLMAATIEFCKLHPRAAEHALLFPMILRSEGINNSACEVITKVLKESLHPGHVSAFFHKLLCGERETRSVCLPCHQRLISDELVWNEAMFSLFQTILIHKVHLTQDSVSQIALRASELAERFPVSLKFGNFLLHFVNKCAPMLRSHRLILSEAAKKTDTIVTKTLLSKVAGL